MKKGERRGAKPLCWSFLVRKGVGGFAIEDSVICALSRDDVASLMMDHQALALRVIETLAHRLQQARSALDEMTFNDVTGRVADILLRLSGPDTNVLDGYSRQELALMVGCRCETLTVTLDRFKRSEAVAIGRKRIEITDRPQLERVVSQRSGGTS